MKLLNVLWIVALFTLPGFTQINGNGKLKSVTKEMKDLKMIDIQFNANITLDYDLKEEMTITADENVLTLIGQEFKNGKLTLDQIKWIEPSKMPTITIGTPFLESIYQGTHSKTIVKNVEALDLMVEGNVGKVIVAGKAVNVSVVTTGTDIDLSNLEIQNGYVSIDDDSEVVLDKINRLQTDLDKKARLVLLSDVEGYAPQSETKRKNSVANPNLKWIQFKIKNNSFKRNHFVVEGPKKDGSTFSYGFSLFPGWTKSEKWSVGTKVYKETKYGGRELLVTISSKDEGEVVKLFN